MLVFPLICASCGCQIGAMSLLYVWLRAQKFGKRPDNYDEAQFGDLAECAGIVNPCCWSVVHGTLTLADLRLGIKLLTHDGKEIGSATG